MKIRAESVYNLKAYKALNNIMIYRNHSPKTCMIREGVILGIMILLFLSVSRSQAQLASVGFVLIAIIIVLRVFCTVLLPRIQYNSVLKRQGEVCNVFVFEYDEFSAESVSEKLRGTASTKYTALLKAMETSEYIFLFIDHARAYIVSKEKIENGTAEDISKAVSAVLGKKYIKCKY